MITVRAASDRGRSSTGWLHSAHSFSFGSYFDLRHQGHGNLLVLNDDTVAPGQGFGSHGHRDMEIVSYVLSGALAHQDNVAQRSHADGITPSPAPTGILRPGDVQRMSAGWGVQHSEFNALQDQDTHFLQIWFKPLFTGIRPSYEQKHFPAADRRGRLVRIASRKGLEGSVSMNADASLWAGLFDGDAESATQPLDPQRLAYVHLARGTVQVNGVPLAAGDGALLENEHQLTLANGAGAEVLVFDLARR
ncbi:pirin family protein [Acidovorax sp. NB1]|uniref:pirin family protein n=1 Tax=Acidovorax sp. NB1 TaxID=1943571 RepID=UPI0010E95C5D|nr:pirin family protein [Acidovorax sp. NB1]GDY36619.1 quercetin 2,3-dioxygenase [Acidovorax sp. NB1]